MMEQHSISVQKTARYFTLGNPTSKTKTILFVCHGYAQAADEFLVQFSSIQDEHLLIVAPEGLHRFYQRGAAEKVVASWMTKEDRDHDIRDYVLFLDQVRERVLLDLQPEVKVVVLGFSQGAATASRWAVMGNGLIHELILWCGFFPPDLPVNGIPEKMRLTVVTATEDKFIPIEQADEQLLAMRKLSPHLTAIRFDGQHVVDQATLKQFSF